MRQYGAGLCTATHAQLRGSEFSLLQLKINSLAPRGDLISSPELIQHVGRAAFTDAGADLIFRVHS